MSSTDFASLTDVRDRLDWELDDSEQRMAQAALEDASSYARLHGNDWPNPAEAPRQLRTIVLGAVVRYMRNPEGYVQSRAGDETVIWAEGDGKGASRGSFAFNDDEINLIKLLAGKAQPFFGTVDSTAWRTTTSHGRPTRDLPGEDAACYVPTADTTAFPFFSDLVSPW